MNSLKRFPEITRFVEVKKKKKKEKMILKKIIRATWMIHGHSRVNLDQ